MDFFGYAGGVLYVDLTRGEIRKEALDPALVERFLWARTPEPTMSRASVLPRERTASFRPGRPSWIPSGSPWALQIPGAATARKGIPCPPHRFCHWKRSELTREDVLKLLDDDYDERGWEIAEGTPSKEKLSELGIEQLLA